MIECDNLIDKLPTTKMKQVESNES